jgi:hypothetical protein
MITLVKATGLKSFKFCGFDFLGTGIIFDDLKHDGTNDNSKDQLKI